MAKAHPKKASKKSLKSLHRTAKSPARSRQKIAAKSAKSPISYTLLCASCGSTRIDSLNAINTCADCHSTQMLTVPSSAVQETQNGILQYHVEHKFHQYMDQKHQREAHTHFLKAFLIILVIMLLVLFAIYSAGI